MRDSADECARSEECELVTSARGSLGCGARAVQRQRFSLARFLLDGPVLPLVTDTIRVAEQFRSACMGCFKQWCIRHPDQASNYVVGEANGVRRYASPTLSGKDADAVCLTGHKHTYYLPTNEENDLRRITHVTLFAREGFDKNEEAALSGLKWLDVGGREELRVQLIGLGQPGDFRCRLFDTATDWISATPFIGPSHIGMKGRQRYLRKALARECRRKIGDKSSIVSISEVAQIPNRPMPWEFRRARYKKSDDGFRRPCGYYRLKFSDPIAGPLSLGYSSHFGLGMFVPAE